MGGGLGKLTITEFCWEPHWVCLCFFSWTSWAVGCPDRPVLWLEVVQHQGLYTTSALPWISPAMRIWPLSSRVLSASPGWVHSPSIKWVDMHSLQSPLLLLKWECWLILNPFCFSCWRRYRTSIRWTATRRLPTRWFLKPSGLSRPPQPGRAKTWWIRSQQWWEWPTTSCPGIRIRFWEHRG